MHLKKGLIVKEVNGEYLLLDSGIEPPIFNGLIKLNETGRYIISLLMEKDYTNEELYQELEKKYQLEKETYIQAVNPFIEKLEAIKLIK